MKNFLLKKMTGWPLVILISACSIAPICAEETSQKDGDIGREKLLFLFSGEWISRAVYVAAKLEIPKLLGTQLKSVEELARLSSTDVESLYRLLRLLTGHGIFQEKEERVFSNTELSSLLIEGHPGSLHSLCLFYGGALRKSWDFLLPSIQQGVPAFELTFHQPVFSYFKNNPVEAQLFQAAMREKSQAVIESALFAYDFTPFCQIYDLGGGQGQFLRSLLLRYPHVSAFLFELPEVIEKVVSEDSKLSLCPGDFFSEVPLGGDLYILKSVLHDWDDERAVQILQNCSRAMSPDSRLLIIEVVLQPTDHALYANSMDLLMLAITGGKERTLSSFEAMLKKAELTLVNLYPTITEFSILEVKKNE